MRTKRQAEQQQPSERCANADLLGRPEPSSAERKDADTAGGGRLDEGERREPQRHDVEHPAAYPTEEPDEPASIAEKREERQQRPAQAERRQTRRGGMLQRVAAVDRDRRCDREQEPGCDH